MKHITLNNVTYLVNSHMFRHICQEKQRLFEVFTWYKNLNKQRLLSPEEKTEMFETQARIGDLVRLLIRIGRALNV